jgi:hypothetical protein
MIALLLAAQIAGQASLANPNVQLFGAPPQARADEIIRTLRAKGGCAANPGRMEVSLAQPAALYRKGDRPPKMLGYWAAYPDGQLCPAEATR